MKILITILVTLLVSVGIGTGVWMKFKNKDQDATAVRLETVGHGELVEVVTAPGIIQAKTKVSISARIAARIIELPYREGDHVTKGNPDTIPPVPASVLVRLVSRDVVAQLRAAQARAAAQASEIQMAGSQLVS